MHGTVHAKALGWEWLRGCEKGQGAVWLESGGDEVRDHGDQVV